MKILEPMPSTPVRAGDSFRCRNCGATFRITRWDALFRFFHSKLKCPECGHVYSRIRWEKTVKYVGASS